MQKKEWVLLALVYSLALPGCMPLSDGSKKIDNSILWVQSSAEYEALALQAYSEASDDLGKFVANSAWSALPGQQDAADLPIAIITDVDETIVSNVEFQAALVPPFEMSKLDNWNIANAAIPIPGAVDFVKLAQDAGVEVFFLTNRQCDKKTGVEEPCPQKAITIQDLREIGIEVDAEHVMLANERLGWDREKLVRREYIGKTHRVIMLLGDDLGDFISCTREKPLHPCSKGATIASRHDATIGFSKYWGEGWYVLPNPMHGSWTSVQ